MMNNRAPSRTYDRFQLLIDSVEDYAIYMLDREGRVVTWNRGAQINKGYSSQEILGKHLRTFFVPEDVSASVPEKELEAAFLTGRSAGEGWRLRKNGERFWASFVISAMRSTEGSFLGFAKVVRDLSDRKRHEDELVAMESALRQERDRLHAAAESSMDALYICETIRAPGGEIEDFTFTYLNSNVEKMVSIPRDQLLGAKMCEILPINRTTGLFDRYKHVVATGTPLVLELPIEDSNVFSSWLRIQAVKLGDGIAITASDVTKRKLQELELLRSATFMEAIIASSPFATIVTDQRGTITSVNPAAESMLWYRKEDLVDRKTPLFLFDPKEVASRAALLSEQLHLHIASGIEVFWANPERGLIEEAEWKLIRRDGSRFDAQVTVSALTDLGGVSVGLVLIAYDITERKRAQEYISHIAHHDALTGLPTRTLFHDRLSMALARAFRYQHKVGILMVDLDNFKRINDQQGHHAGDELLKAVAESLRRSVRSSDTVARLGGDEFVILLDRLNNVEEAELVAEKIRQHLAFPIAGGEDALVPTASIGVCCYPDHGQTFEGLLKNADAAMYEAKLEGKNGHKTFSHELESTSARKRQLEAGLKKSLTLDELEVVYQPQISMKTGLVTGVEALLRWRSGNLGMVMPNDFIPLAEETGLIVPIGEWVLRTACRHGKLLQQQTGRPMTMAVNVSPRQFQQSSLPGVIQQILKECNFNPSFLELEITENLLLGNSARPLQILEDIRSLGVHVAIDDFGTGFSSMSYILRFRVDRLKIDQSFVRDISTSTDSSAITKAVIALARGLNITVVAEGVESVIHRDMAPERRL